MWDDDGDTGRLRGTAYPLSIQLCRSSRIDYDSFFRISGRREGMGFYVAVNSKGHIATRQTLGTRKNYPSLHD